MPAKGEARITDNWKGLNTHPRAVWESVTCDRRESIWKRGASHQSHQGVTVCACLRTRYHKGLRTTFLRTYLSMMWLCVGVGGCQARQHAFGREEGIRLVLCEGRGATNCVLEEWNIECILSVLRCRRVRVLVAVGASTSAGNSQAFYVMPVLGLRQGLPRWANGTMECIIFEDCVVGVFLRYGIILLAHRVRALDNNCKR